MKRFILICLIFWITDCAVSQSFYRYRFEAPWSVSASIGPTQYFGELYSLWKYNEGVQPDWNATIAVRKVIGTRFKGRLEGTYYQISGQDPPADPRSNRQPRDLHFRARNWEVSTVGELYLKAVKIPNIHRDFINFYLFAGIGVSSNDPKTQLRGEWVALRPFQVENNPYDKFIVVFPTGIGMKYKANVWADLFLEINYRWTLTDYMDDISAFNVSEFYLDLIKDYGAFGEGPNPDRLRLAIRNPNFLTENGEPDVDRILKNNGRIRRGSGLTERFDGYLAINVGVELFLSEDIWDNWIFRNRIYEKRYRFW